MSMTIQAKKALEAYRRLPESIMLDMMAFIIVAERVKKLSVEDMNDLLELIKEFRNATTADDRDSIHLAIEEILAQMPLTFHQLPLDDSPVSPKLRSYINHVGGKIKELREKAGLTQVELSKLAGLPQSHVSRLEHGEHSPTNITLTKLAKALKVDVHKIDPSA